MNVSHFLLCKSADFWPDNVGEFFQLVWFIENQATQGS
ncbi:uncharacterized protein METZ01_LOCUS457318, partial [marine metagenome]